MKQTILGLLLIAIAFTGLVFWETNGRDMVLTEEVVVADTTVKRGSEISAESVAVKRIAKANLVPEYIKAKDVESIVGNMLAQDLIKNQQLSESSFLDSEGIELSRGKSYYVIKSDWITMRSSAIKRGDTIEIRTDDGLKNFGNFKVAFVKNGDDVEIEGDTSNNVISHIEVIASLNEYLQIKSYADSMPVPSLILVRKGGTHG